jgi:hypothetical protein
MPTILAAAVTPLVDDGSSMPSSASSTTTASYRESGIAAGQLVGKQVTWQERQTKETWVGPVGTQRGYVRGG